MSLRYLLDTHVVMEPMGSRPDQGVVDRLGDSEGRCAIAATVWHELWYGCSLLPAGKRRNDLELFLNDVVRGSFPILPYEEVAARWHGDERARLDREGQRRPQIDGQIAAVARVNELILVTRNVRDFMGYRDLQVEDWYR